MEVCDRLQGDPKAKRLAVFLQCEMTRMAHHVIRCAAIIRSLSEHSGQVQASALTNSVDNDPQRSAPGSWQRIGGESPPRGRSSQPPRPRVMHEVLPARAAVKRSQGIPRAKY